MKKSLLLFALAMLVLPFTAAAGPRQVTALTVKPTPADTDSVLLLHGAFTYPGYWWDHTDITVAVQAHPGVERASLEAVHQAITDWNNALAGRVRRPDHPHRRDRPVHRQAQGRHRRPLQPDVGRHGLRGLRDLRRPQVPEHHRPLGSAAEPRARPVLAAVPLLRDDARVGARIGPRARDRCWSRPT